MTIQKLRLTCQSCRHIFDGEIVVDAPIAVAVASMQAVRCPECYSDRCGMGGNYADAPPVTAPLADRVRWWRERGEHGTSSETIYAAFCGGSPRDTSYPKDPDDFRRCKLLLDLLPEWRAGLGKGSLAYPWFAPMIAQWDEIERLYIAESPSDSCPKCYALMASLRKECDRLR